MKALLIRVGIDTTPATGEWNAPIDGKSGKFVYVPIRENFQCRPGLATPYLEVAKHLGKSGFPHLPDGLAKRNMHLDPDFKYLTYGDQGERAKQISKLGPGDLLVFYASLRDVEPNPRLVYAIIGLYVIDCKKSAMEVKKSQWKENAHTRRPPPYTGNDIVVRARPGVSGRCAQAMPIGEYYDGAYRVRRTILSAWGGLEVKSGWIQRGGNLPAFKDASRFYRWFRAEKVKLVQRNN